MFHVKREGLRSGQFFENNPMHSRRRVDRAAVSRETDLAQRRTVGEARSPPRPSLRA